MLGAVMGGKRFWFGALASAVVLTGTTLATVESARADDAPHFGWTHRVDARPPAQTTTDTFSGGLRVTAFQNQFSAWSAADGPSLGVEFLLPTDTTLHTVQPGTTFRVGGQYEQTAAGIGQVLAFRDGEMCGRTRDELETLPWNAGAPTNGWFRIDDVQLDGDTDVVLSLAATYQVNCQFLDGPAGFEGSFAYNAASAPAPVPAVPTTPGPVSGVQVHNTEADSGGSSTSSLSWTPAPGTSRVIVDLEQSKDVSRLPAVVGSTDWASATTLTGFSSGAIDWFDTRTYRIVAQGPSGRLSTPAYRTVLGSRMNHPYLYSTIQYGQTAHISGRITDATTYLEPDADPMSGDPIPGRTLLLCQQAVVPYLDTCNVQARATSDADGRFTFSVSPLANSQYSVMLPATPWRLGNNSWFLTTNVSPRTDLAAPDYQTLRVASNLRTGTSVKRGSTIYFTTSRAWRGSVRVVKLQRWNGSSWRTILRKTFAAGTTRVRLPWREYHSGTHAYRVVKIADSRHVNGRSKVVRIRVR